jgi:hypothetical protein
MRWIFECFYKSNWKILKSCTTFDYVNQESEDESESKKVGITYIDQAIPSMFYMPLFEVIQNGNQSPLLQSICSSIIDHKSVLEITHKVDFTGQWVAAYAQNIEYCDIVRNCIVKYMTNYTLYRNGFKSWIELPEEFNTSTRREIAKEMAIKKNTLLRQYCDFQNEILQQTHIKYDEESKLLIQEVSLKDEVTTICYGMAIIELLVLVEILVEETGYNNVTRWTLSEDFEEKRVYLCMDGLSLDRH